MALFLMSIASLASAATLTIRPNAQGSYTGWANVGCSSGSSEWQCVDEDPASTADYLRTTGTSRETFAFGNTGLTSETINSVTLYYYAMRHNGASNACFKALVRSGGVNYLGGTQLCTGTNWSYVSQTFATNPATGNAWTVSEVDALESGMQGVEPNAGGRVAQVYAVVDYSSQPPEQPDLVISSLTFNEYTVGNGTNTSVRVTVHAVVKNQGLGMAGASTTRLADLSTTDFFTPSLAAGATHNINKDYACTAAHTETVTADWFGVVSETDETNNAASAFIDCVV